MNENLLFMIVWIEFEDVFLNKRLNIVSFYFYKVFDSKEYYR